MAREGGPGRPDVVDPLLKADTLVNSNQNVELAGHCVEKAAVRQVRPAEIDDAGYIVAMDALGQPPGHAVVEENPHLELLP